ncbi:MAG: hypothetical protein A2017_09780 [Lentisphaerae bacterium GWF2_44_16]|nr:MAG: hypothetical protein A2017_09780 [Lentisphaerae bacterium GWF2_44_16]
MPGAFVFFEKLPKLFFQISENIISSSLFNLELLFKMSSKKKNKTVNLSLKEVSSILESKNILLRPEDLSTGLSAALQELSSLDNSSKLREDAIRNGKAIIKNWAPPTDEQIDKIFIKMRDELLA